MRQKTPHLLITFSTTAQAMKLERCCLAHSLPGRLIPVPTEISAGCGLAWSAPPEAEETLMHFLREQGIATQGVYTVLLR